MLPYFKILAVVLATSASMTAFTGLDAPTFSSSSETATHLSRQIRLTAYEADQLQTQATTTSKSTAAAKTELGDSPTTVKASADLASVHTITTSAETQELSARQALKADTGVGFLWPWEAITCQNAAVAIDLRSTIMSLNKLTQVLQADTDRTDQAVSEWKLQQTALAAATIAAENVQPSTPTVSHAAPKTQPGSTATLTITKAPPAAPSGAPTYNVHVRVSVTASGTQNGQSAINGGGQVAVIWPGIGTIVSAHDTSDPRAAYMHVGDIVNFSGAVTGRYIVTGLLDVQKGAQASSVLSLGTSMMMQTCLMGTHAMRIVGLRPA